MLDVADLVAGYGSIRALDGVTIHVPRGKIVALFGSNGAGKTTLMHTIAGLMHPMRGTIAFDGVPIGNEPAHKIFERGVALVPQGRQLFPEMSVRENLELGGLSALAPGEIAKRIDVRVRFVRASAALRLRTTEREVAVPARTGRQSNISLDVYCCAHFLDP